VVGARPQKNTSLNTDLEKAGLKGGGPCQKPAARAT